MKAIIGRKVGMSQIFDEKGHVIPVTVIEAGPCVVTQKKTSEKDGYEAVQLGYEDIREAKLSKPELGHLNKAGVSPKKYLREFDLDNASELELGAIIKADTFKSGDFVDVTGTSKGHGYTGVIKRWNASRGRMTHGGGPVHRHAGSMGSTTDPSRIFKGKIGPGQYGVETVTIQNLEVVQGRPRAQHARRPRRGSRSQGQPRHREDHRQGPQDQAGWCRHQQEPAEGFRPQPAEGFRQKYVRKGVLDKCLRLKLSA